ncbi:MAG: Flp family type IVb pilin [Armatimonadetes bacterium CG07_land_8_20_14_0_80_59_28]|nr:MAG: Flp family type IVb pilin [Armatimonadetes bacterium CG07_land_8_20_14_0_80_59_28]PIX38848.1 MAG: Flp family type IVb pilin [Armatimonadetes bacterium CG_4_8_14_3_um_filter_58_9]
MSGDVFNKGGAVSMIKRLVREEEGQTLVEYGLLVALIALVVIAILTLLGTKVRNLFVRVNTSIASTT